MRQRAKPLTKFASWHVIASMSEGRPWKNSHQTFLTPNTFYTRHLIQFTSGIFYKTPFTPANVYTTHRLHETSYYTSQHQPPFTPVTFNFAPGCTFQQRTWTQNYTQHKQFYTRQLLHQTPFKRDDFYTKRLLHQTPDAQKKYYSVQQFATAYHKAFFCTTKYYLVLKIYYKLDKTTPYYKVSLGTTRYYQKLVHTTKYYSVLQSTRLHTTKY